MLLQHEVLALGTPMASHLGLARLLAPEGTISSQIMSARCGPKYVATAAEQCNKKQVKNR